MRKIAHEVKKIPPSAAEIKLPDDPVEALATLRWIVNGEVLGLYETEKCRYIKYIRTGEIMPRIIRIHK